MLTSCKFWVVWWTPKTWWVQGLGNCIRISEDKGEVNSQFNIFIMLCGGFQHWQSWTNAHTIALQPYRGLSLFGVMLPYIKEKESILWLWTELGSKVTLTRIRRFQYNIKKVILSRSGLGNILKEPLTYQQPHLRNRNIGICTKAQ